MDDKKLNRLLCSIGKRCFENCYEVACKKRENLTIEDLIKNDPRLKGTTKTALATRLNCIKRIVKSGHEKAAFKMAKNRRR